MAVSRPRRTSLRKPSFRDHMSQMNAANAGMEAMFGDRREAKGFDAPLPIVMKPKREIVNRSDPNELEGAVLKEVGEVLAAHPNVIMCVRQNSGSISDDRGVPIWFYRWVKNRAEMTITDYWGFGRWESRDANMNPCMVFAPFAIECKRRDWKQNYNSERENAQNSFIDFIIRMGGRGGFCTSAHQALAILK